MAAPRQRLGTQAGQKPSHFLRGAYSFAVPTLPTDGSRPACTNRSVYLIATIFSLEKRQVVHDFGQPHDALRITAPFEPLQTHYRLR